MSELAAEYYQARAELFGVTEIPQILDGQALPIFQAGQALAVHNPNPSTLKDAAGRLGTALESVNDFLLSSMPDDMEVPTIHPISLRAKNAAFIKDGVSKLLLPKSIKAGQLNEVTLEAIARSEVQKSALGRGKDNRTPTLGHEVDEGESREVYFGISGRLKSGPRTMRVGALIVARATQQTLSVRGAAGIPYIGVRYSGTALKNNEILGRMIRGESNAISQILTKHSLRNPYNGERA